MIKNPPANTGDTGDASSIPGSGRSLEKEMAAHSSILAWEIPGTEASGQSMGPHMTEGLSVCTHALPSQKTLGGEWS